MTDPKKKIEGIQDLYESEKALSKTILGALQRKYASVSQMSEDTKRRFELEAKGVFAENGLVVSVNWDFDVSDNPDDMNLYVVPKVIIEARVDKVDQFDHDQQKHEIRAGVFDGVKGVIDPNTGTMKEEPKSKLIT